MNSSRVENVERGKFMVKLVTVDTLMKMAIIFHFMGEARFPDHPPGLAIHQQCTQGSGHGDLHLFLWVLQTSYRALLVFKDPHECIGILSHTTQDHFLTSRTG